MQNHFNTYLDNTLKLTSARSILLTISGGADSIVMLDLFSKTGYKCGVAHCNFHLRGDKSNKDEKLVRELAKKYNYPFYQIDFFTTNYATQKGISIEMAARELRYNWFEKVRRENGYDYIATGHHQDDVIETFFINLARGTGIRGLSGIKPVSGNLIRPILFADHQQILSYIKENKLEYREDASNYDVKYKRNKLRQDIIPELAEINPAYKQNILKTIERLNITNNILKEKLSEIKANVVEEKDEQLLFNISKLKELEPLNFFLFELLFPYGFNGEQVESIIKSFDGISGKSFYSSTYELIKDRNYLIIIPKQKTKRFSLKISDKLSVVKLKDNSSLQIKSISRTKGFKIPQQLNIAALDKDKLHFPLEIRNWQKGNYFYPIGMKQKKKLSDFFVDNKFSKIEKEKALLLISKGEVVWVIGHRLDNGIKLLILQKIFCK
ncbi:MAG: tRNA lysidine(34) synthetase TilS [Bacteroidetes bacterium]|nr:MAG: tRNA lysidine(34) synthetase TilS [Bacteroidota bacterium]